MNIDYLRYASGGSILEKTIRKNRQSGAIQQIFNFQYTIFNFSNFQ